VTPARPLRLLAPVLLTLAALALPYPGLAQRPKGKRYALLAGVKAYDDKKLKDLEYTENDVVELARLLRPAGYEVILLTESEGKSRANHAPTGKNIRAQLKALLDRATKHDTVLVAFSGHGLQFARTKDSYFCPRDANARDPKTLVSLKGVYKALEDSRAGLGLLLVDACRDEAELGGGKGLDGKDLPHPPRGVAALFSCSAGQRSYETKKLRHGVFFHAVLQGLKGEARNKKGEVTWGTLSEYVKEKVSEGVPKLIGDGARQEPNELQNLSGRSPILLERKRQVKVVFGPEDWPGWRGADRTGVSREKGLLAKWPEGGPKLAWKAEKLGGGYSTPSVAGGRIYLLGTDRPLNGKKAAGEKELLIALDARDGARLWATPIGVVASNTFPGPRSTPTVDGELLYAISSDGKLVCAETARGKLRWTKDLKAGFAGKSGRWGYAESPLVDGDVVVCTPGGDKATLLALNKKTGATVWRAPVKGKSVEAGYSSALVAEVRGVRQYIQFLKVGVVGISAQDGKELWQYTRPASRIASCSTPIFRADCVFAASGYNTGGGLVRLTGNGKGFLAKEEYFVKPMQNHHGGVVLVGDHLYGTGAAKLFCVSFKDGKVAWEDRSVGKGSITCADGHLYVRSEKGPVALVEATPAGYKEKGRFSQPSRSKQSAYPHPVIAGGKLYLRDWDVLLCYNIKVE
jgi:outer membrane protein assembly factor BamB